MDKQIRDLYVDYLIRKHEKELIEILNDPNKLGSFNLKVNFEDLTNEVAPANSLFDEKALDQIELLKECLTDAQKKLLSSIAAQQEQEQESTTSASSKLSVKLKVFVRFVNVRTSNPNHQRHIVGLPEIKHLNRFVTFDCTVMKASASRMLESSLTYQCNKCGHEFTNALNYREVDFYTKPKKCPNDDCQSDKYVLVNAERNLKTLAKDYQELRVQEKLNSSVFSAGSSSLIPKSFSVILDDDLVDCCKPGDDITLVGIVIDRWERPQNDMRCEIQIIVYANNIKVNNEDPNQIQVSDEQQEEFERFWRQQYQHRPFTARNIVLESLCPQLYGMYIVKLAVALLITGGVSRRSVNGTAVRGHSHLLLVGDPGTGKSQFLKCVSKLCPRSVLTTGIGSTSAGLTATASRDGGIWHLEAGALVLADGGICCVDEFNFMREHDKTSMLEAMEQQSISVAKAGIVCRLKTECSVIAACNPKGAYDSTQPLTVNIALSTPLLSRFDVVLLLLDSPNADWDHLASRYQLEGVDLLRRSEKEKAALFPFNKLRCYMNVVKSLEPNLTSDANTVIQRYYQFQRKADDRNAARTTVRMLESLIRLSQAHAKLMFRDEVLVMDAVVAITIMECSLNKSASFGDVNILHTSFPVDAELEYRNQAELILGKLELSDVLEREIAFIDQNFIITTNDDENEAGQAENNNNNNNKYEASENECQENYEQQQQKNDEELQQQNHHHNNFDIISQLVGNLPSLSQLVTNNNHNNNKKSAMNGAGDQQHLQQFQSQYVFNNNNRNKFASSTQQQQQKQQPPSTAATMTTQLKKRKFEVLAANDSSASLMLSQQEQQQTDDDANILNFLYEVDEKAETTTTATNRLHQSFNSKPKFQSSQKLPTTTSTKTSTNLDDDDLLNFELDDDDLVVNGGGGGGGSGNSSIILKNVNRIEKKTPTQTSTQTQSTQQSTQFVFKKPDLPTPPPPPTLQQQPAAKKVKTFKESVQNSLEMFKCDSTNSESNKENRLSSSSVLLSIIPEELDEPAASLSSSLLSMSQRKETGSQQAAATASQSQSQSQSQSSKQPRRTQPLSQASRRAIKVLSSFQLDDIDDKDFEL